MRVPLKLLSFAFGIFSLTFARGQECHSSDIKLEDTEPLDKPSYDDGERVKVNCITGFSGMYKFKCNKGNWEMALERKCTKKKCGHPGDTPNGDFRLLGGNTEFVFGVTVQYACNKGYEMASRINQRTCRNSGWDNAVPLCVNFCSPPLLKVNNASLINETLDKRTYSHGDTVRYVCADGFQSIGETIAQCNVTWTYPECIRIDECLKPTQNLEFMTLLNERNTYSNFEILKYSCNSPYNEIPEGAFMCQEGNWHGRFVCTSNICPPPPYLENGDYTIKNQVNNVTTEVYYTCQFYYVLNKQQEYKCLNGRWETPPKCLKPCKITPDIYKKYNIKLVPDNYTRHSDKDFRLERNPGRIVGGLFNRQSYLTAWCTDGELRIESFCSKPLATVNNAILIDQIPGERKYSHGDTARYECVEDYESNGQTIAKCDAQTWIYPECIKKAQCVKPTMSLQFVTLLDEKMTFNNFEVLRYTCNEPYDKIPNGALICKDGKWNGTFDCTSSICPPPPIIENGDFNVKQKKDDVITMVSYSCQSYYVVDKQKRDYKCLEGKWDTPPKCLKPCKITPDIYKDYNIKPFADDYVKHSAKEVRLYCKDGRTVGGYWGYSYSTARCTDGELRIESKCT